MQSSEEETGKWRKSGAQGEVTCEVYKGSLCAVKRCKHSEQALRELEIALALQGHKNIIQVLGYSFQADQVVTYMECVPITLLELMSSKPGCPFSLITAHRFFMEMLDGLQFIHNKGYVHKDIKLENILVLFDPETSEETLRLIDFGFSLPYTKGKASMVDNKGSYHYAAPEIWHGIPHEGPNVDIWALGVVLFLMVTGCFPFGGQTPDEIYEEIEKAELWFPKALQSAENKPLRNLIKGMLAFEMQDRLSLDQILVHPWVSRTAGPSSSSSTAFPFPPSTSEAVPELDLKCQFGKIEQCPSFTTKTPRKSPRGELSRSARIHSKPSKNSSKTTKSLKKGFLKRLCRIFH